MLYGLMLPSGNDASLAIAVWGGKVLLNIDDGVKPSELNTEMQILKWKKKECYTRFLG